MESHDGLVNYYGVFVPQLHDLRGSSEKLCRKNNALTCSNQCLLSFTRTPQVFRCSLFLTHCQPDQELFITDFHT